MLKRKRKKKKHANINKKKAGASILISEKNEISDEVY